MICADLELYDEDHSTNKENNVSPSCHPWDDELEKNVPYFDTNQL